MKPWMKALVWLGLGGGIGFFAGYQLGYGRACKEMEPTLNQLNDLNEHAVQKFEKERDDLTREHARELAETRELYEAAMAAQREYLGEKDDEVKDVIEEDPEMPEVPDLPDDPLEDEEIPQPHPEDFLPFAISRSEYLQNENGYETMLLDYYTDDAVIFDPVNEEKWTHPEQLLGIGWKAHFVSTDGRPVKEIFIQNDTMGTLYKITRIEASFAELYEEE